MTPTLSGRLQTRLLLAVVVGLPVSLLVGLLPGGISVGAALLALAVLTALGLGWECVYHLVQQRRWDGDWPASIALGVGVVEALVVYPVLGLLGAAPRFGALMGLLAAVWIALWAAAQGPVSVFLPQWRYRGARVVAPRSASRSRTPRTVALAQFRPTRQQLVVLGGVAAMAVAVLLLAPLVGSRTHTPMPTAMAHKPVSAGRADGSRQQMVDVRRTTWDTTHRIGPHALRFPAAGVGAVLDKVRMTSSGSLGTPSSGRAAWFAQGAAPGQRGPAVIIGDSANVFARLGEVRKGQRFAIARFDRSVVRFVVDDVVRVDAAQFPTHRVYGPSLRPLARLIGYDTATGRNVIVFAHAVAVTMPAVRS